MSGTPRAPPKPDLPTAARGAPRYASQESVDALRKEVNGLAPVLAEILSLLKTPPPSVPPPSTATPISPTLDLARQVYESCAMVLADRTDYEDKERRAVVIGSAEPKDPSAGLKQDEKLVKDLVDYCGDPDVKKAWEEGKIIHHRHPKERPPGSRPLKIELPTKTLRDSLLSCIRAKPGRPTPLPPPSFIRRDLTPHQLQLEREAREEVKKRNLAAGSLAYGVRDFSIVSYRNPRALPANYGMPRPSAHMNPAADLSSPGPSPLSDASSAAVPTLSRAPIDDHVTKRNRAAPAGDPK